MRSVTILEDLPLPCKLNSLYTPLNRGRYSSIVLSKKGRIKRDELVQCIAHKIGANPEPYANECYVSVRWHPRDKRKCDIDSIIKQLLDCLVHAGVMVDDSLIVSLTVEKLAPKMPGLVSVEIGEI